MLKFWIGNEFPIDLIYDLGNYTFYCLIFFYFYKKKFINRNLFMFVCILMLTPFLFNNFLIDWRLSPDQSKYLSMSNTYRKDLLKGNFSEYNNIKQLKVYISSYIFALSPILNIETFKSIAFLNRFLLIGTSTYFFKKRRIDTSLFIVTFLSPSLTYFSSITLREILILVSMIWAIYFILEKKNFSFLFLLLFVLLVKPQNALILIFFLLIYIFTKTNKKFLYLFFLSSFFVTLLYFYSETIYQLYDLARRGLFLEAYGGYRGITSVNIYESISFDINSLIIILDSLFYFIISPLLNTVSPLKYFIVLETFLLYLYFTKEIIKYKNSQINTISIIWILITIFSFALYSVVLFNDGTIHRYRIGLIFFIFYGYNLHKNRILTEKIRTKKNE